MGEGEARDPGTDSVQPLGTEEAEGSELHLSPDSSGVDLRIIRLGEIGYRVLRTKCASVEEIDDEVKLLAASMIKTMYESKGVGLAAPQIGIAVNIAVIDPWYVQGQEHDPVVMINPEIYDRTGSVGSEEACLSCFGVRVKVPRDESLSVRFTDLEGEEQTLAMEGFEATVVAHELDHLQGTLIVDYLSWVQRDMYFGKIRKAHRKARKAMRDQKKYEHHRRVSARRMERATGGKIRPISNKDPGGAGPLNFRDGTGESDQRSEGHSES